MKLTTDELRSIIKEELGRVISEARTDVISSLVARGFNLAYNEMKDSFTNTKELGGSGEESAVNVGVVSFQFKSDTKYKKDARLIVSTYLYDSFNEAPVLTNSLNPAPNNDAWLGAIRKSSKIADIKLTEKQIETLDKQNILNNMRFLSIAFLINDFLYNKHFKSKVLRGTRGAAIDKLPLSNGNGFIDSPEDKKEKPTKKPKSVIPVSDWAKTDNDVKKAASDAGTGMDLLSMISRPLSSDEINRPLTEALDLMSFFNQPLVDAFAVISSAVMPSSREDYRAAFHSVISTIVHEIEHSFQKGNIDSRGVLGSGDTFQSWLAYLSMPDEVEAHVSQFYYLQQRIKIPWIDLVKKYLIHTLEELEKRVLKNTNNPARAKQEKEMVLNKLIDTWTKYAKKRFPLAKTET